MLCCQVVDELSVMLPWLPLPERTSRWGTSLSTNVPRDEGADRACESPG